MYRNYRIRLLIVALGLAFGLSEVANAQTSTGSGGLREAGAERLTTGQALEGPQAGAGRGVLELVIQDLQETRNDLIKEVRGLREEVDALRDAVTRAGAWEPVGNDIKIVVGNTVEYEYALVRNGGFRTLTASNWNRGWRVMTSEYMTLDAAPFRMGGSMWSWGTDDPRERECGDGVLHHYYFHTGGGIITDWGNGCRSDEGTIYRRRR